MECEFCDGTEGVRQCPDSLVVVCEQCVNDAQDAAQAAINSDFPPLRV